MINAGDKTMCFAAGHGQFPCSESVASGGFRAPPLNVTQVELFAVEALVFGETPSVRNIPLV